MKRWYIRFPGSASALGPIEADNEREARRWAREWAGLKRLPNGFECWQVGK